MIKTNPFSPSFGRKPRLFIGRDEIRHEFLSSLAFPDDPWRTTIVTGTRGSGKTVLISEIRQEISKTAIVLKVTAENQFLDNLFSQLYQALSLKDREALKVSGLGLSFAGFGATVNQTEPAFLRAFQNQMVTLLEKLGQDRLVVIFIDEVQKHSDELRTFVATYQELIMENANLALLMAGLPHALSDLLSDDVLTFFRRANQVQLQPINVDLINFDYQRIFKVLGLDPEIVKKAAQATFGYPYLVQLVGYHLWRNATNLSDKENLERTMIEAKAALFQNVHEIIFSSLTGKEKDFLFAMAQDEGTSLRSSLVKRLKVSQSYFANYRARLLASRIIVEAGRAELRFDLPYMREYLLKKI